MKLFLIRHSKSCSNLLREDDAMHHISKNIRDPGLSNHGVEIATTYGPALKKCLEEKGLDVSKALIASSGLARASHTANILFGRPAVHVHHIKENGNIPENTGARKTYQKPNWFAFLKDLEAKAKGRDAVVVAHGSFIKDIVIPHLTGVSLRKRFNNMDGILVTGVLQDGKLTVEKTEIVRCPELSRTGEDRCNVADTRKIARISKMMARKSRKQKGGGVSMPLAYYQDGAQFNGTSASETGGGLAGTSAAWVKAPLSQTGGRRSRRNQRGGFAPGIMGAFAVNGARLAPMALYLGRKMFSRQHRRIPVVTRRRSRKNRRTSRRS